MLELSIKDENQPPAVPRRFVRSEIVSRQSAIRAVVSDDLALYEPESEGYNPYDHTPAAPVELDDADATVNVRYEPKLRVV